ncbi:hypothetical protein E2566_08070 [Pectobacterium punjabense]|uniref:Uncharacterized protein n=1 Tax=Pectobacterium punjabense TaxID=2108399 RepID=A0ABX6L0R3_9GAMM|nr:hypothetical protein [Pectobacterium punjabense]MBS4433277.1 hypothetical protein [Pectobacterium punjabense]PTA64110.1 hypothetical protein C9I36_11385 [Pectobacterium punjabense]QJA19876.1 hypothetical protein E2566_08070 [Pectobacterium punjabense]
MCKKIRRVKIFSFLCAFFVLGGVVNYFYLKMAINELECGVVFNVIINNDVSTKINDARQLIKSDYYGSSQAVNDYLNYAQKLKMDELYKKTMTN